MQRSRVGGGEGKFNKNRMSRFVRIYSQMKFIRCSFLSIFAGVSLAALIMDWRHHLIWIRCGLKLKDDSIALSVYQKVCLQLFFGVLCMAFYLLFDWGLSRARALAAKRHLRFGQFHSPSVESHWCCCFAFSGPMGHIVSRVIASSCTT